MTTDTGLRGESPRADAEAAERKHREAFTEAWYDLEITISDIMTKFGMGTTSLYRHVFVYGLPKRPLLQPGGRRQLREMFHDKGLTVDEIADSLGHRKITISRALEFHDLLRKRDAAHDDETPPEPAGPVDDFFSVEKVLGRELRKLRKRHGWTRRDLRKHIGADGSLQALASYEMGTRKISVPRLFEVCLALGEHPSDLLKRVQDQVYVDAPWRIRLDLRKVVEDERQELGPVRQWAATLLNQDKPVSTFLLEGDALAGLAELCGIPVLDLEAILRTLSSRRDL